MMTVVTKSGTNRLRGSLYEFLRNDVFDALGYFDATKSKLRRNQFGATLSGPVYLPKLYDGRNRTFFMFTWDSLRLTDGKTQRGVVPDPDMLRGDFSKATDSFGRPITITDSVNRVAVPWQPDSGQPPGPGGAEAGGELPAGEPNRQFGLQLHLAGQRHHQLQQFRRQGGP